MVGDIMQPTHLLFVLAIALLVLGPKRLPEVGRTLGSGIRDFRQALSGEHSSRSHEDSPSASELHQPSDWPEDAVGPTSFDEPVEAASAEPTSGVATDSTPTGVAHSETDDTAVHGTIAEEELASSEHDLARQTAETSGQSAPQTD